MIPYEEALRRILNNTHLLPAERIMAQDSVGRTIKEDIYSTIEMPPFDKSAMDGFALIAADARKAPVKLKCIGLIQAGQSFKKRLKRGECVKIMTGAPLPEGADSVAMVENSRQSGDAVEILSAVKEGENVCFRGEDLAGKQKVLNQGVNISPSHVALLATVGRRFVRVVAKPEVSILNTGGEIVQPGNKLGKNKIYNSNGPMLEALLKSDGIQPNLLGIAKDNDKELKEKIKTGLAADILLISGGVSMGDYDLVPDVLRRLGVKPVFHKVNIKPGKPLFFGLRKRTLVFGIPGNPVSNFLAYLVFIRPAIQKLTGREHFAPEFKEGIMKEGFYGKISRKHFVLVMIDKKDCRYYLTPISSHGSADIPALAKADGFMVIDKNSALAKKGSKIKFITWKVI